MENDHLPNQNQTTSTVTHLIPINFVYNSIKAYLHFYNLPTYSARMKIVDRLFDGVSTFKDIRLLSTKETMYDDCIINKWFADFNNDYLADLIVARGKKKQSFRSIDYIGLLELITQYLRPKGRKGTQNTDYTILTEYAENKLESRLVFPEPTIKNDDGAKNYSLDNYFKKVNEFEEFLQEAFYIPDKADEEDTQRWEKLKRLKTPFEDLDAEQVSLYNQRCFLQGIKEQQEQKIGKSTLHKVNQWISEITEVLKKLAEDVNVGRSQNKKVHRFDADEHMEHLQLIIIEHLDYTNPSHVVGLIENYYDLSMQYQYNVDSPIYAVLQDFRYQIPKIKLKHLHKGILFEFLHNGFKTMADRKLIAKKYRMSTENLTKMIERTIAKKISKFFMENMPESA